jgi:hypothetical protein
MNNLSELKETLELTIILYKVDKYLNSLNDIQKKNIIKYIKQWKDLYIRDKKSKELYELDQLRLNRVISISEYNNKKISIENYKFDIIFNNYLNNLENLKDLEAYLHLNECHDLIKFLESIIL